MSHRFKLVVLLAVLLTLLLATGAATMQQKARSLRAIRVLVAKDRAVAQNDQRQTAEREIPVAEYNAPEPNDPAKRALRQIRSKRHDIRDPSLKPEDGKPVLTERSVRVNLGGPWSHALNEPAIPVAQSDAVLVGEIVGANAYLSNDKTSIYSEFTVLVTELLKDTKGTTLIGNRITVERSGGGLRFPSGKVLIRGLLGKPLPKMNGRYAFFLKRNNEGEDFSLITAYELRGGKVLPLDGLSPKGEVIEPFAAYQQYKGEDETTFLTKLWSLVQSPAEVPERRR